METNIYKYHSYKSIFLTMLFVFTFQFSNSQIIEPFTQRTSVYSPGKQIYNIQGDFTMIGNTNLTLDDYSTSRGNQNMMIYVDEDSNSSTFNSSSATLELSEENGASPDCSNIIYAGLYWTGRSHNSDPSPLTFSVTKNSVTKEFDKRKVLIQGPNSTSYTEIVANANDIYYPETSDGYMFSAYAEVTDYVKQNGLGEYFVGDIALREGTGGGTGYYGGWSLIVIYENSKMNWRDVTIFDGCLCCWFYNS
jgi:hypothetical protein